MKFNCGILAGLLTFVGAASLLPWNFASAQTVSLETFKSDILHQDRKVRIRLPVSYAVEPQKRYPLILALDGEYLFYSAVGAATILELYEVMPEAIVVAIDQNYSEGSGKGARWVDCTYDEKTGQPKERGALFKSFITDELLPHVDRACRTTAFRVIAGHSFTATYINFFLADKKPAFQTYIAISPTRRPRAFKRATAAAYDK